MEDMGEKEKADFEERFRDHMEQFGYFRDNLAQIEEKYGKDTYVVIHDKQIVDSGSNEQELDKRYSWYDGFYVGSVQAHRDIPKMKKKLLDCLKGGFVSMSEEEKTRFREAYERSTRKN